VNQPSAVATARYTGPPKKRRSRAQLAAAIVITAVGGLASAAIFTSIGHTSTVLVLRKDVTRGSVIQQDDLTTAQINSDPAIDTVAGSQRGKIVGKYARVDLAAGSTLTPNSVSNHTGLKQGQSLIGLALSPNQMPAKKLIAGDNVRLVITGDSASASQGNGQTTTTTPAGGGTPSTLAGIVADTKAGETVGSNDTIVDVAVDATSAPQVASYAAAGNIALILEAAN
jgi:hypothetical protein